MSDKFEPIGCYSNWCYLAALGGREDGVLKNGEALEVRFPDGTVVRTAVLIEEDTEEVMDMGHYDSVPITRAYFQHKVHGAQALVRLDGAKGITARRCK